MSEQQSEQQIDESTKTYLRSKLPKYLRAHGIDPQQSFTCLNFKHQDQERSMRYNPEHQAIECSVCKAHFDIFDLVRLEHNLPSLEDSIKFVQEHYPKRSPLKAVDLDNINNTSDDFFAGITAIEMAPGEAQSLNGHRSSPNKRPPEERDQLDLNLTASAEQKDKAATAPSQAAAPSQTAAPSQAAASSQGDPFGHNAQGFDPFAPLQATHTPRLAPHNQAPQPSAKRVPSASKPAPLGDVRAMGSMVAATPRRAELPQGKAQQPPYQSISPGYTAAKPQAHTAPTLADPFSDPAFLQMQRVKPTFAPNQAALAPEPHPDYHVGRKSKLNPPNVRDLDHITISKEEIQRRSAEIWGTPEPTQPKPETAAPAQHPAPTGPTTLINGHALNMPKHQMASAAPAASIQRPLAVAAPVSGVRELVRPAAAPAQMKPASAPAAALRPAPFAAQASVKVSSQVSAPAKVSPKPQVHNQGHNQPRPDAAPNTVIQRSQPKVKVAPQAEGKAFAQELAALNNPNEGTTRIYGYSSALHGPHQPQHQPTSNTRITMDRSAHQSIPQPTPQPRAITSAEQAALAATVITSAFSARTEAPASQALTGDMTNIEQDMAALNRATSALINAITEDKAEASAQVTPSKAPAPAPKVSAPAAATNTIKREAAATKSAPQPKTPEAVTQVAPKPAPAPTTEHSSAVPLPQLKSERQAAQSAPQPKAPQAVTTVTLKPASAPTTEHSTAVPLPPLKPENQTAQSAPQPKAPEAVTQVALKPAPAPATLNNAITPASLVNTKLELSASEVESAPIPKSYATDAVTPVTLQHIAAAEVRPKDSIAKPTAPTKAEASAPESSASADVKTDAEPTPIPAPKPQISATATIALEAAEVATPMPAPKPQVSANATITQDSAQDETKAAPQKEAPVSTKLEATPYLPEHPKKTKPEFFATEEPETTILEVNPLEESAHQHALDIAVLAHDVDLPDLEQPEDKRGIAEDELGSLDDFEGQHNPLALDGYKDPGFTLSKEDSDEELSQDKAAPAALDAFSTLTATANVIHPHPNQVASATHKAASAQGGDVVLVAAAQDKTMPTQVQGTLSHYLQRCKDAVGLCSFFSQYGLSPELIERYSLGFDPSYRVDNPHFTPGNSWQPQLWQAAIIPLNEDSYVAYNIDSPHPEHPDKRYVGQERCFNLNVLTGVWGKLSGPIFICSGELDALTLLGLNLRAVALGAPQHTDLLLATLLSCDLSQCQIYLCLPSEPGWNEVKDFLLEQLSSHELKVNAYPYPNLIQALTQNPQNLNSTLQQLAQISEVTLQSAMSLKDSESHHLILSLEALARLELSPMMYALSSSAVALSRLVIASLIENKSNAIIYAGTKTQWQLICALLTFNQYAPNGYQAAGYQARFLELPLEQNAAMLEATLNHGIMASRLSGMAKPTLMVDTFAFDHGLCAQLSPRLAQLSSELKVAVVVCCSAEQQSIFEGNALQTLAISQGVDNELIFTTLDSACKIHTFSTKQG